MLSGQLTTARLKESPTLNAAAPAFKQGDCPPADAGSSVPTKNHAVGSDDHVPLKSRSCHQLAANSTAADAATARLKESPTLGSQQGDYGATDALISPVAAEYAQGIAAADLFSTTSRAAATATDRLKESPVCGPKQGDYSATDALSPPVAAQIAQDLANQSAVSSSHQSAVSSGHQSADTHPLSAASQQGDCTRNSAVGGAGDTTAAQNAQDTVAAQNDPSANSLAAAANTARLKESPSAISQQEECSAGINFGSIIGFLLYRFKFPLYGFRIAGLKLGMASIAF